MGNGEPMILQNESSWRVNEIFERISDAFVALDKNWRYTYMNKKAGEIFSRDPNEIIGKHIWTEFPEGLGQPFHLAYEKAMAEQQYIYMQEYYQPYDRWFENHIYPSPEGLSIFFRDITEKKRIELALQESELRYRSLIDQASDAIMITDTKGNLSDVNISLCKLFGYTREELLKSNINTLIDPQQLKGDPVRFDILTTGQAILRERRMMHKNGTIIEVEANVKMLPDGRILAIARDITDRKKAEAKIEASEKKLRQVLTSTPDNFYVIDRNYQVILINATAEKNLEKDWGKPVKVGTNLLDVIPDRSEPIKKSFEKVFEGHRVEYELQVSGDDLPDWVHVSYTPVHDENDIVTGAYVIATDISENKKADEALKANEKRLNLIYNTINDIVFLISVEEEQYFRFQSVNKAFLDSTGLKSNEVEGKYVEDVIPEPSLSVVLSKYKDAIQTHHPVQWEETSEYPSGRKTGIVRVTPVINESGNCVTLVGTVHDITERRKAEQEIKESEERYRALVENATEALVVLDVEKRKFVSVSESAVKLFKKSKEELLKMGPIDLSPEYQPNGRLSSEMGFEKINEAVAGNSPSFEWMHCDSEGNRIPCEVWLVRLPSHKQILIRGTIINITERKKTEQELNQHRIFIESIINASPDIIYIYDIDERKNIYVNDGIQRNLGYNDEEIKRMGNQLLAVLMHPDDFKYYLENTFPGYMEAKDKEIIVHEFRMRDKKDEWRWLQSKESIFLRNPDGSPKQIFGISSDVTERKKNSDVILREKNLSESIINSLPGIFYLFDKSGKYLRWNKNVERVTGYSSDEIRHMKPLDFVDTDEKELIKSKIENIFVVGEDNVQAHLLIKSGKKIPYYFTGIAVDYENEQCFMGVGIDFSERIKAQEKIKETTHQLRQLTVHLQNIREEERKRIGREIHDELGQQLTAIKMDVAWIDKKIPDETTALKNKLKNVIKLLDGSNQSVRKILSELRPDVLDNYSLLEALHWQGQQFTNTSGIPVIFTTQETRIETDPETATCLFRVYQESLTNIMRYAKASNVLASLSIKDGNIILKIQDDGQGFDPSLNRDKKSFGILGMQERVLSLNGKFDLQSAIGQGTKILVSLPHQTSAIV